MRIFSAPVVVENLTIQTWVNIMIIVIHVSGDTMDDNRNIMKYTILLLIIPVMAFASFTATPFIPPQVELPQPPNTNINIVPFDPLLPVTIPWEWERPPINFPPMDPPVEEPRKPIPRPKPFPIPYPGECEYLADCHPSKKGGGVDPLVVGDWYYHEVDAENCYSKRAFDYDNDYHPENFCYEIVGDIFVIDFGNGINHGYNMLNFYNTNLKQYEPVEYLKEVPNVCELYSCYLWHHGVYDDWIADEDELTPYNIKVSNWNERFHDPIKIKTTDGKMRFIYGIGDTHDGKEVYALKPTYWMTQEWMK